MDVGDGEWRQAGRLEDHLLLECQNVLNFWLSLSLSISVLALFVLSSAGRPSPDRVVSCVCEGLGRCKKISRDTLLGSPLSPSPPYIYWLYATEFAVLERVKSG